MTSTIGLITFSFGLYSDKGNDVFRILKPFTVEQLNREFRAQWKQTREWDDKPSRDEFLAWAILAGYVEDIYIPEYHTGDYFEYELSAPKEELAIQHSPVTTS